MFQVFLFAFSNFDSFHNSVSLFGYFRVHCVWQKSKFIHGKLVNNGSELWKLVTKEIIVYSIILLYNKLQQFSLDNDLLCINVCYIQELML